MFWDPFPHVTTELDLVREEIHDQVSTPGGSLTEGLIDMLTRNAKLLRPGCLILAARVQNGGQRVSKSVISLAAAVEMLHVASLIHDDIVDGARTRRGGPSVHMRYGAREAVLMGDFLFTRCMAAASEYASPKNVRLLSSAVSRIVEAEIAETQPGPANSVRAYLRRVIGKTALLFAASFHIGASESGDDQLVTQHLRRSGYNLGVAFQIVDDMLDLAGTARETGKATGIDLKAGVLTLPVLLAARRNDRLFGDLERLAVGRGRVRRITRQALASGGLALATAVADQYTDRARREIDALPRGLDYETLRELPDLLLARAS